jgi:hypothetical protein
VNTWDNFFDDRRGVSMIQEIGRWMLAPFRLVALIIALLRM